jgi:hypothetical protein
MFGMSRSGRALKRAFKFALCVSCALLTLVWACCAQLDSALQELCKGWEGEREGGVWPPFAGIVRCVCAYRACLGYCAWVARCCAQACIVQCICAYRAYSGYSRSGLGSALLRTGLHCTMCLRVSRLLGVLRCCHCLNVWNVALGSRAQARLQICIVRFVCAFNARLGMLRSAGFCATRALQRLGGGARGGGMAPLCWYCAMCLRVSRLLGVLRLGSALLRAGLHCTMYLRVSRLLGVFEKRLG